VSKLNTYLTIRFSFIFLLNKDSQNLHAEQLARLFFSNINIAVIVNSLVPNGEIYLSLIYIQLRDDRHVIPLRVGG